MKPGHSIPKRLLMRKFLFVLLFTPLLMQAQPPAKDSSKAPLRINKPYPIQYGIKAIRERKGRLIISPAKTKWLSIGGNYTFSAAARSVNTIPSLQDQYVQGQSSNGSLVWQGPETNQVFSYGPSVQDLEYDGSPYPYDINGKLVPTGAGDGKRAASYNNGIFRMGHMTGHYLTLQANIKRTYSIPLWAFSLKAGANAETTVIPDNRNTSHSIFTSAERYLQKFSIAGSYSNFSSRFSNDNSNGFLNRVYQNALQTPVSYSNAQGPTLVTGGQRAYSSQADNPWFLLKDNGHFASRVQQTGNLSLQKKQGYLTFGVITTLDAVDDNSNQSLQAGTASFPAGLVYTRRQNDDHYSSNAYLAYRIRYDDYAFSSTAKLNYIYNDEDVKIYYPAGVHAYHRSSSDASFIFNSTYDGYDINAGFNAGNKFYMSNTSLRNKFFLPELSGFIASHNLLDYHLNAKLAASYTSFCSEPPINHSLSAFMLTQLTPQEAFRFIPFTEVRTFASLSPMQHREFTSWIQLDFDRFVSLHADFSIRNTKDNTFPVYENNQLVVKNIADTRYKGVELQLQFNNANRKPRKISTSNSISFYKFSNTVTRVQDGYDNHPIAGFYTIYKALVKGQPVGLIMGNSFLRDAANNVLIGPDGFPLVNDQLSVIGNPTPDYTLKFSHLATWKAFSVNIDWEYRKGGDIWNGTAAALDYYGRSTATAVQRNITGYVFAGKLQNGGQNQIPVAFYDAALPVGQNRWVRYGYTGVAASYIQKGDNIRIHTLSLAYDIKIKKYLQRIKLTAYAQNLLLWSAYKGADPNQLLYDQPGSGGLDFFNLPSTKTYGASASIQF